MTFFPRVRYSVKDVRQTFRRQECLSNEKCARSKARQAETFSSWRTHHHVAFPDERDKSVDAARELGQEHVPPERLPSVRRLGELHVAVGEIACVECNHLR